MPIDMKKGVIVIILIFLFLKGSTQMVFENPNNDVYEYLSRLSHKGIIEFDDLILPISRTIITSKLLEIKQHQNLLSQTEKKELDFYLTDFKTYDTNDSSTYTKIFSKNIYGAWSTFSSNQKSFFLTADPIIQYGLGEYNGIKFDHRAVGTKIWGAIGSHIGFQFSIKDVTESRNFNSTNIQNNNIPGFVNLITSPSSHNLNYTEYKTNIGYNWKNGQINIGQDVLEWGYGSNGRIVLSEKSPASPYLRIDYQPLKWLKFNYAHIWLNSNVIDSSVTYSYQNSVYGGKRITYIPKFLATHSITVTPKKGIDLSFGESMIYSDKLNFGYLIPIMYFKGYDNNISNYNILAGSNGQFFFQLSLKNIIPKTHLYSTLFIDEIKLSSIFSKNESRNQIGFNLGASTTDFLIKYLTIYTEYTRVNPSVYNNLNPAQTYTNYGFNLGDWMGNNFDRSLFGIKYTPIPKLKLDTYYQLIRKGVAATINEQYFAQPQPIFLSQKLYDQRELYLNASYEIKSKIYLKANYTITNNIYPIGLYNNTFKNYTFSLNFGF
jgi:hypothetical protein